MWDLWWDKVALDRFSPSTSISPAIVVRSTNYSTITLMYHPGKMYKRPMCGRSTGTYKNLGDLQRDLRGLSPTPPNKKNMEGTRTVLHVANRSLVKGSCLGRYITPALLSIVYCGLFLRRYSDWSCGCHRWGWRGTSQVSVPYPDF
jgi:hypothetical protein